MPNANGQTITIDGSNSGQTFTGDNNTFSLAAGALSLTVNGLHNNIGGGTGPNTYTIQSTATSFNSANGLTTGSGNSITNVTGDWTAITANNSATNHVGFIGNHDTALFSAGANYLAAYGDFNIVTGGTSGTGSYLLSGQGSNVNLQGGNNAVGLHGSGLITGRGASDTLAFLAGSTQSPPVVNSFDPARDHLSVLLSTSFYPGLTDSGLSPHAFLDASRFETGSGPTRDSTRFVYDPSSGLLSYTPYGSANNQSLGVARLPTGLNIDGTQIYISNRYVFGATVQNALDDLPSQWGVTSPLPTAPNAANFDAQDVSTGVTSASEPGAAYTGPVSYLRQQLNYSGNHNIVFHAHTNNVFMSGGDGTDALQAQGGQNVLDGGTGSNFLVGGTGADGGTDTFFTDARTSAFVWNSIVNFHPGDMVTLYGFIPGQSSYSYSPSEGAAGYQGLTMNVDLLGNGQITAKVTLAGLTPGDIGHLVVNTGTVSNIPYLAISNV